MPIISLTVGSLLTNCYIVVCEETLEALIIDPGFSEHESSSILREIERRDLHIKYVVNTHGHIDHISGNAEIKKATKAKIMIHENDAGMLTNPRRNLSLMFGLSMVSPPPDRILRDGDRIRVGSLDLEVLHTPGHTPGSISLYCRKERVVFTGDTLFAGSIGRTDFPESSYEALISSIRGKLLKLPDETVVYPGHGEGTSIGRERRWNPFLEWF